MSKKPTYSKLTPEMLDTYIEDLVRKGTEKQFIFHTGKSGLIAYKKALWLGMGTSKEDVDAKVQYLQDNLEEGVYTLTT